MDTHDKYEHLSALVYNRLTVEWGRGWDHLSDKLRQALFVEAVVHRVMDKPAYEIQDVMDTLTVMISKFSPTALANQERPPKEVVPKSSRPESENLESNTDRTIRQTLIRLSSIRKILDEPNEKNPCFYLGVSYNVYSMAHTLRGLTGFHSRSTRAVHADLQSVKDILDGYDFEKLQSYKFSETAITSLVDDLYGVAHALHAMSGAHS